MRQASLKAPQTCHFASPPAISPRLTTAGLSPSRLRRLGICHARGDVMRPCVTVLTQCRRLPHHLMLGTARPIPNAGGTTGAAGRSAGGKEPAGRSQREGASGKEPAGRRMSCFATSLPTSLGPRAPSRPPGARSARSWRSRSEASRRRRADEPAGASGSVLRRPRRDPQAPGVNIDPSSPANAEFLGGRILGINDNKPLPWRPPLRPGEWGRHPG
jgi:hypothetical protein